MRIAFSSTVAQATLALAMLVGPAATPAQGDVAQVDLALACEFAAEWSSQRSVAALPLFRVFDSEGRQIWEETGLSSEFLSSLARVVDGARTPDGSGRTLMDELSLTVDSNGSATEPLPPAELTFSKYWADWCKPCFAQTKALDSFFDERSDTAFNLANIEADLTRPSR